MHVHFTWNSRIKVVTNAKRATKYFGINVLTTFIFVKVPDNVIYNVPKKVIDLMIILFGWTFIRVLLMIIILLLLRFYRLRLINLLFDVLEYVFWRDTCIMKWNTFFDISRIGSIKSNRHIFYQLMNTSYCLPWSHNPSSFAQSQWNREMSPVIYLEHP